MDLKGIYCANFAHARGIWGPCRSVWCGPCYTADPNLPFHVNAPEEDEGIVWKRRKETSKFMTARSGDGLFTPFQCDSCVFKNIKRRAPKACSQADMNLMGYIRRANLDALWSRATGTITGSVAGLRKIIKTAKEFDMLPPLEPLGPWPVEDIQGMRLAITILKASQAPGRNDPTYTQFDSIRKISSSFGNHYEASLKAANSTWVLRSDKANSFFTDSPVRSEFFTRFMSGLKSRMGRDVRGDIPIDYHILHKMLININLEILDKDTSETRRRWLVTVGAYFILSFVLALRGNETLMLDLRALTENIEQGRFEKPPHVVLPLLGLFKGEEYKRLHILLAPDVTDSGFEPRKWVHWLVQARRVENRSEGPAFCDNEGYVLNQQVINDELKTQLVYVKEQDPTLFPPDLKLEDINTNRSFRKGSTSRAQNLLLSDSIIDSNNRWRTFEQAKGSRPTLKLRDHYSSMRLMVNKILAYPQAM